MIGSSRDLTAGSSDVTTSAAPAAPGRPRLTSPQAAAARQIVAFAAALPVSPDARVLALTIAARAARDGQANLTSSDLRRYHDPQGVLDELAAARWIAGDLTRLVHADPAEAFPVTAAGFAGLTDPPMGALMRSRVSGWISRALVARPLKKASATTRLAALTLVLHADPTTADGVLPDLPEQVVADLTPAWITPRGSGGYQLSEIAAGHLPAC